MKPKDGDRWTVPYHAMYRCALRVGVPIGEASEYIHNAINNGIVWKRNIVGSGLKKSSDEDIMYGTSDEYGVLIVAKNNMHHSRPHWCVLSVYKWDSIAGKVIQRW